MAITDLTLLSPNPALSTTLHLGRFRRIGIEPRNSDGELVEIDGGVTVAVTLGNVQAEYIEDEIHGKYVAISAPWGTYLTNHEVTLTADVRLGPETIHLVEAIEVVVVQEAVTLGLVEGPEEVLE